MALVLDNGPLVWTLGSVAATFRDNRGFLAFNSIFVMGILTF